MIPFAAESSDQFWANISFIVLGAAAVIGFGWRLLVVPAMHRDLQTVVKQLTENGGKNDPATVPDRFHAVSEHLARQDEAIAEMREDIDGIRKADERRWSEHYAHTDGITDRINALENGQ